MCEPSARKITVVIRNRTSGVFVIPAQARIQISQSRVDAAFAGMTRGGVERQISALSGQGKRMLRKRRNEKVVKSLKTNKAAKSMIRHN
jgi:hypothetical protein